MLSQFQTMPASRPPATGIDYTFTICALAISTQNLLILMEVLARPIAISFILWPSIPRAHSLRGDIVQSNYGSAALWIQQLWGSLCRKLPPFLLLTPALLRLLLEIAKDMLLFWILPNPRTRSYSNCMILRSERFSILSTESIFSQHPMIRPSFV